MGRLKGMSVLLTVTMILGCSGKMPGNLGVDRGRLALCPDSPNCVSSQSDPSDRRHYIEPLRYRGTRAAAKERLVGILSGQKRVRIVANRDDYLHAEFKSAVMGFVDDVEFYFPDEPVIQVRSAARLGYSDFGVNRKRIERIRAAFQDGTSW